MKKKIKLNDLGGLRIIVKTYENKKKIEEKYLIFLLSIIIQHFITQRKYYLMKKLKYALFINIVF